MAEWYRNRGVECSLFIGRMRGRLAGFFREERGDLVSSLGWMAIMALVLIVIKGLVDGGLTRYVETIFTQLDRVFNPGS